ncbi:hypothetical protein [Dactylosporangium darangshiense]|uniref:Uncharacterized protein n=2 Tax=Dactylosporangium darangshiense TaxID=579108 RepID=A0ABP8DMU6_9ACTN
MTQPATLRVETRALVAYGTERYEDAVTCGAIRRFLGHVGAVPAGAWVPCPTSPPNLRQTALDYRIDEAIAGRNEMEKIADILLQIAADFEGTDIVNATSFDVVNQDLAPYMPTVDGYDSQVRTRPGGAGIVTTPHNQHDPYERPALVIPPENTRLAAVGHEVLPSTRLATDRCPLPTNLGHCHLELRSAA